MDTFLRFRSRLCYILATILAVFSLVLLVMLVVGYLPDFMAYPLDWIISFFPQDDDELFLLCFICLVFGLLAIPGIIIFGLIKRGQYLERRARREYRIQPIMD